jgi:hypothetical protein
VTWPEKRLAPRRARTEGQRKEEKWRQGLA